MLEIDPRDPSQLPAGCQGPTCNKKVRLQSSWAGVQMSWLKSRISKTYLISSSPATGWDWEAIWTCWAMKQLSSLASTPQLLPSSKNPQTIVMVEPIVAKICWPILFAFCNSGQTCGTRSIKARSSNCSRFSFLPTFPLFASHPLTFQG